MVHGLRIGGQKVALAGRDTCVSLATGKLVPRCPFAVSPDPLRSTIAPNAPEKDARTYRSTIPLSTRVWGSRSVPRRHSHFRKIEIHGPRLGERHQVYTWLQINAGTRDRCTPFGARCKRLSNRACRFHPRCVTFRARRSRAAIRVDEPTLNGTVRRRCRRRRLDADAEAPLDLGASRHACNVALHGSARLSRRTIR